MTDNNEAVAPPDNNEIAAPPLIMPPANLPPPKPLTGDDNLATSWRQWKKVWQRYEIAAGIYKQSDLVSVSTLLSVIGEDAVKIFDTFTWREGEQDDKITDVLVKFDEYCEPRTQVIYERYRFNNRKQEPGESIAAYVTELRMIAKNCAHEGITPEEILRDRLVLGIRDDKVRERLLRVNDLTLQRAIDICKAAEQTNQQLKVMQGTSDEVVAAVKQTSQNQRRPRDMRGNRHECRFCGYHHATRQCPAYGQTCSKCGQKNHFQSKCHSSNTQVNQVEVPEEVFHISQIGRGARAMFTMEVGKPSPQSQVTFQLDTGAECNLLSLKDYKRTTGDERLRQVNPCSHKYIKTYTNERYQILGDTEITIWGHAHTTVLQFNITRDDLAPLLCYKTCLDLGLITVKDSDDTPHPPAPKATLSVCAMTAATYTDLLDDFKDVFEGLGNLPGEYHIVTDETVPLVVHPPRRVPVALREQIKTTSQ